jgi:hypothetical protein
VNASKNLATAILAMSILSAAAADAQPGTRNGSGGGGGNSWETPILSFSADQAAYLAGERALLSWASANTRSCEASGDWSGRVATEGTYRTPPLEGPATFTLTCTARGNISVQDTLRLDVLGIEETAALEPETLPEPEPQSDPEPEPAPVPVVRLDAASEAVDSGDSTTLTWSSDHADTCSASGDWSGGKAISGSQLVGPLSADAQYVLSCTGAGGSASATVAVQVNALPPTLSFSSSEASVRSGDFATLTWTSSHTEKCSASGGWSGARPTSGSEVVGPLQQGTTFSLTCSGEGGSVLDMLTVNLVSPVTVSWVAPTENVDGSPLTQLAGYRLYVGQISGLYTETIPLSDPSATTYALDLESGSYYLAMTAIDASGNESAYSNEIARTAP